MRPNIPLAVTGLIDEYRRFLRTSYRFLDDRLREQFEDHLAKAEVVVRGPYVTLARDFVLGQRLDELIAAGKCHSDLARVKWAFGRAPLFLHQVRALETGRAGRSFLVTTGTGSGKTESFLLPVLDGILRRKAEGRGGVQAVLLYPMNALANDQLERLRRMLRESGVDLSFALYTGDSEKAAQQLAEKEAETELLTRDSIRRNPPDILLTNYKQLEFLLVRREDRMMFGPSLRYLVLDELHSYRGALATEIACLIRRLKAHSGLRAGELLGIGTSATVASGEDGVRRLAEFATGLLGEAVLPEDVIGEALVPFPHEPNEYVPDPPTLGVDDLARLDVNSDDAVVALAERLTGRRAKGDGHVAERVAGMLRGNAVVRALEETFAKPAMIAAAIEAIRARSPARAALPDDVLRREIDAYLVVGSVGDEEHPPRLRPKLHAFFHGVYDVNLCLDPRCRTLVPQGGSECAACGSVARPAALCRTCGQDFVKVLFERADDDQPRGTGDFFSDDRTGFLTHKIHALSDDENREGEEADEPDLPKARGTPRANKLEEVDVCRRCGRITQRGGVCLTCGLPPIPMLLHRGPLHSCPACGQTYTRGDVVTPLRTGTASTVSVLATHHLDHLVERDRKLLVFSDNRQDAAHQAGYTEDRHRRFALRHVIAHEVRQAGTDGLPLETLVQRVFDTYLRLRIVPGKPTRHERQRWSEAIRWEIANELTRHSRQRASLENLGLVAVEYEFLDDVVRNDKFRAATREAGLKSDVAAVLARAVLDVFRRRCAVALDFFQEYVDPNRKSKYRELEAEPYCVRFPDRDRSPKAFALDRPDHIRKTHRLEGIVQENERAGQLTAPQKLAFRLIGDRRRAGECLRALVEVMEDEKILVPVPNFPIPAKERTGKLRALQIDPKVLRFVAAGQGFRCDACQTWRPYTLSTCATPSCTTGTVRAASVDRDNYYVRLYLDRAPQRLRIQEHTAQIDATKRAEIETQFKEGKLDALVCTPTLELGVDIGPLLTVVLRNAPPSPANYAQRVGRAGRRLRIGFASTFCASGAHDRHAFEDPAWLVSGQFDPPRLRLDNERIVRRHLHSFLLENIEHELPARMGNLLDDLRTPTAWRAAELDPLLTEVRAKREVLVERMARLFEADRRANRTRSFGPNEVRGVADAFEPALRGVVEAWFARVRHLDQEFREFAQIGSPRHDQRKAEARRRAYYEITQDPDRSYTLNYLATHDVLPAYQFPLDTFSLDPGVTDTPTLYRPASIAIEEFAPGNFVYANGHKLLSIRVLLAGARSATPGGESPAAFAAGRLRSFQFCRSCQTPVEATKNSCPACAKPLNEPDEVAFVDAFEAEENFRIGAEEESRQRQSHVRKEHLVVPDDARCFLYPYELAPLELLPSAGLLVTNWGARDAQSPEGRRFWLCPDCGRHLPHDPMAPAHAKAVDAWRAFHKRFCAGEVRKFVLGYQFDTNALVLTIPSKGDRTRKGSAEASIAAMTLAQALLMACEDLLEIETGEVGAFVRTREGDATVEQIVFYENVPGGAGYLEQLAARLPAAAEVAQKLLYDHDCAKACYVCLKHYRNQYWHGFFNKDEIRDVLVILASLDRVEPQELKVGAGRTAIDTMLAARQAEAAAARSPEGGGRYRHGEIEETLLAAMRQVAGLPDGVRDYEIIDPKTVRIVTVPDFTWLDEKLAVFCDSYAHHSGHDALVGDAQKRNWLQVNGWLVLTFWGRTINRDARRVATEIAAAWRGRNARAGTWTATVGRPKPDGTSPV